MKPPSDPETLPPPSGLFEPSLPRAHSVLEGPRYVDVEGLGQGGMATVRRVWDRILHRNVAMKLPHSDRLRSPADLELFLSEARTHAGLQHPNIVRVFDVGQLPDGRPYFTMEEVRGRTLRDALRAVHDASRDTQTWTPDPDGWTLRSLVEALRLACEGVAFAHARGVLHRDLKPTNIMVGPFSSVLVMDWGLALVRDGPGQTETQDGSGSGTLPYMPPEQLLGDQPLDARTDVYALGATLYELLSGRPPYLGSRQEVEAQLRAGPPDALARASHLPLPQELVELVEAAMQRAPQARLPDAQALVQGLRSWLEGQRRRAEALALLEQADPLRPQIRRLREEANTLTREADLALRTLPPWAPEAEKRPWWSAQDRASNLSRDADLAELEWLHQVQAALQMDSSLPEAQIRLAEHYQERHAAAEAAGDGAEAARAEALLRAHDRGRFATYLRGDGELTLYSEPPAEVWLHRYVLRHRRLQLEPLGRLGQTPLLRHPLPMGSYRLTLRAPGHHELLLPVSIPRGGKHQDLPPGEAQPFVHPLAPLGTLGPDEVLISAGWFRAGGHSLGHRALAEGLHWTPAFVLQRHPVTLTQYIEFLNAHPEDPSLAPDRGGLVRREGDRFVLGAQAHPQWPVVLVPWTAARAYADWLALQQGRPWQLLPELWWEKAARGVDGRRYPTGPQLDGAWAATKDSAPQALNPSPIGEHPLDESPYGVLGLAGNVRCWCEDPSAQGGYPARGGAWNFPVENCASALRSVHTPDTRAGNLGIRLGRAWR